MTETVSFDLLVIGAGPAGQKAAIQGAKIGRKVLLVEAEPSIGGACVQTGTIPSKTLRETAVALTGFRKRSGEIYSVVSRPEQDLASLMARKDAVIAAHEEFMTRQVQRNGIEHWHGRAGFVDAHTIEVRDVRGQQRLARADKIVIATGSRPRTPPEVPVDHEHIFDSDSLLSMIYLPESLTVLGSGVIASEYASIFAALGVKVIMVEKGPRPLGFLDADLTDRYQQAFESDGGRFIGNVGIKSVEWDGIGSVITTLSDGTVLQTEKLFCALGRVANVEWLRLENAGVKVSNRNLVEVDANLRTNVPHIFAAGDVIGPPSLASASMEQGRRAVCIAFDMPIGTAPELIPAGIYTIPEISSVGLTEEQAIERHGGCVVGTAPFHELARGQIAAAQNGLLKLVADPAGDKLLGVQIIGENASELVHVGQLALLTGYGVDQLVDTIFNFPTFAEGYRVAALAIAGKRPKK